jgi:pyruvate,water dikinase
MAVFVQRQVRAKSAGVAFSLDPRNGDRSRIVIESAWGQGTSVVSGEEADLFVLKKADGSEIERRVAAKTHAWCCATQQGLIRRAVPESRQHAPSVTQEAVGRIRDAVKVAMTVLDDQVDLEWALDETGELQVLQARPETVWTNSERSATSLAELTGRVTATMGGHEDVGS